MLFSGVVDKDIQVEMTDYISIWCDNSGAINILKNLVMHSRTKNISIKYHFLREKVEGMEVKVEYVATSEQVVDIFTKPLLVSTF